MIANSQHLINLVSERNLDNMVDLLESEEVDPKVRLAIAETIAIITKNLTFRKSFLRTKYFDVLSKVALKIIEDVVNPN